MHTHTQTAARPHTDVRTPVEGASGPASGPDRGHRGVGSDGASRAAIPDGDDVEVRNRFENHWVHGFAVATSSDAGYRLRRLSDGRVLPTWFPHDVVRRRA